MACPPCAQRWHPLALVPTLAHQSPLSIPPQKHQSQWPSQSPAPMHRFLHQHHEEPSRLNCRPSNWSLCRLQRHWCQFFVQALQNPANLRSLEQRLCFWCQPWPHWWLVQSQTTGHQSSPPTVTTWLSYFAWWTERMHHHPCLVNRRPNQNPPTDSSVVQPTWPSPWFGQPTQTDWQKNRGWEWDCVTFFDSWIGSNS